MATTNEIETTPERADAFPRWVWLAGAGALLLIGWTFILFVNGFHFTAPVVFVCLGYGAGVASVYTLFRTGASAVSPGEDEAGGDASWDRPVGVRSELEREKKALLKAIKEAEFDLQMGKLSKVDADAMIGEYRARAIAVIRELERKDGAEGSVREQIEREVRARLEVAKAKKAADADRRPAGKKGKKGPAAAEAPKPAGPAAAKAETATETAEATAGAGAAAAAADAAAGEAADDKTDSSDEAAAAKADQAPVRAADAAAVDPSNPEPRGAPHGAAAADVAKEATS
jgi:hypothetical protein